MKNLVSSCVRMRHASCVLTKRYDGKQGTIHTNSRQTTIALETHLSSIYRLDHVLLTFPKVQ